MEAVILMGIQGSGKSTFCRERFFNTHVRLNLDMLRTRHREAILLRACLEAKQPFVVDNTNPTREERARYIAPARAAGFRVIGYYFSSKVGECLRRNVERPTQRAVPAKAILGTSARMELPGCGEGFDALHYVSIDDDGNFQVQEWIEES